MTSTIRSAPAPAAAVGTRERILDAASELFYRQGLRAVSADKIIAEVGITKVTFYRHFRSKDDLIVAYLERLGEHERRAAEEVAEREERPEDVLRSIAEAIGSRSCQPGFRGCAFLNAAAEFADPGHPVRLTVQRHREWFHGLLAGLLAEMGVAEPAAVATQLVMLRDGAMIAGNLDDPRAVREALLASGRAIIGR